MTVNKLHKLLSKFIEQGHGRATVGVYKDTFSHPLECDGCVIINLDKVDVRYVNMMDDDGGHKVNKNGSESQRLTCVLSGDHDVEAELQDRVRAELEARNQKGTF